MIFIYLVIILTFTFFIRRFIKPNGNDIKDIGHTYLPKIPYCMNDALAVVTLILLALNFKKIDFKKYFLFLAVMYTFRFLTSWVTVLPHPDKSIKSTHDYIFSGHTTFNIVSSYFIGSPVWPAWPIVTSIGTVASRTHYTIDVLLAWIIFFAMRMNNGVLT